EWARQTVGTIADRCDAENTVPAGADAMRALARMSRNGTSRLLVVDGDRLLGVLSLKDLLKFFALKMELEEGKKAMDGSQAPVVSRPVKGFATCTPRRIWPSLRSSV
ncbi:MAG: CBS domain-containing protein, partial [Anaerolineales bacterium]